MPKRGIGFNANEISILLDAVEEYLPIGQNDWEMVERMHGRYFPQAGRTRESLKRKFIQLYGTKIPTGDPKCPDDIKRAKYLFEEIKKRSELSDGGGDDGDQYDGGEEEEEDADEEGGGDEGREANGGADNEEIVEAAPAPAVTVVTTNRSTRPLSPFTAEPVSRTGSKSTGSKKKSSSSTRNKRKHDDDDDDDDFSMKNCMKLLMTQHAMDKQERKADEASRRDQMMLMQQLDREERKAEEASRRDQMMQMQQMLMAFVSAAATKGGGPTTMHARIDTPGGVAPLSEQQQHDNTTRPPTPPTNT